jgi:hypothetical protein
MAAEVTIFVIFPRTHPHECLELDTFPFPLIPTGSSPHPPGEVVCEGCGQYSVEWSQSARGMQSVRTVYTTNEATIHNDELLKSGLSSLLEPSGHAACAEQVNLTAEGFVRSWSISADHLAAFNNSVE